MGGARQRWGLAGAILTALCFAGCGTTQVARRLPNYEPPLAKADYQTVRTTAYTHTESDHLEFSNHNALGGELQAADPPVHRVEVGTRPLNFGLEESGLRSGSSVGLQPFSATESSSPPTARRAVLVLPAATTKRSVRIVRGRRVVVVKAVPPKIGSAAADWSRWPAGTTFRLLSTGQLYRVDDYGWALAGRNTIDLYMATPGDMNSWGVRAEPIQILQWGDSEESLRRLAAHQGYKHIRRMVLELQGEQESAASLQ